MFSKFSLAHYNNPEYVKLIERSREKSDSYTSVKSNQQAKQTTRNLVRDMLMPIKGQRILIIEGPEGEFIKQLLEDGHKLKDILVINHCQNTVGKLKKMYPNLPIICSKVQECLAGMQCIQDEKRREIFYNLYKKLSPCIYTNDSIKIDNILTAEEIYYLNDPRPFAGGWLDICNFPENVVNSFGQLVERNLILPTCYFAYTCLKSRTKKEDDVKSIARCTNANVIENLRKFIKQYKFSVEQYKLNDSSHYQSECGKGIETMFFSRIVIKNENQFIKKENDDCTMDES